MDYTVEQVLAAAESMKIKHAALVAEDMWCICPEMKTDTYRATSYGGETVPSWKDRDEKRKAGKDVPLGGCLCTIGNDITLILDKLTVTASS